MPAVPLLPEICEQWCGRPEAPNGCLCLGKLRAALQTLEAAPAAGPEEAASKAAAMGRLREVLGGDFDPRLSWPRRGEF